jgi:hypothetical protein
MERVLVRRGLGENIFLMDPSLFKLHRYLFVLSHARSYSTLLCHILGSHGQISGYIESGRPYETAVDLYRLNANSCESGNYRNDCKYVVDKLLYNELTVSDQILGLSRVTPIFVVREPEPSIVSLTRMRVREHEQGLQNWPEGTDRAAAAASAARYYIGRLEMLQSLCERLESLGGRGILLHARSLLDDTAGTLRFLERALKLDGPLGEEYQVFERTGKPGHGDTSTMIRTGYVVRDHPKQEEIGIPADLLARAMDTYMKCMNSLLGSPALESYRPERAAAG